MTDGLFGNIGKGRRQEEDLDGGGRGAHTIHYKRDGGVARFSASIVFNGGGFPAETDDKAAEGIIKEDVESFLGWLAKALAGHTQRTLYFGDVTVSDVYVQEDPDATETFYEKPEVIGRNP